MELPCGESAACSAGLPDKFVRFRLVLQRVQCFLYRAFYVVAELACLVFGESFQRHGYRLLTEGGELIRIFLFSLQAFSSHDFGGNPKRQRQREFTFVRVFYHG